MLGTRSPVANQLPQRSSPAVHAFRAAGAKNAAANEATDGYDIMASEAHQNNHSYLLKLSEPTFRFTTPAGRGRLAARMTHKHAKNWGGGGGGGGSAGGRR